MKEKNHIIRPHLQYDIMDAQAMTYPSNFFDLIIDKSTIDVFVCGEDAPVNVSKML